MKLFRVALMINEALILLLLVSPKFVENRSLAQAIGDFNKDPSTERRVELERQQDISQTNRLRMTAFLVGLLAVNTAGLYFVSRRLQLARGVVV